MTPEEIEKKALELLGSLGYRGFDEALAELIKLLRTKRMRNQLI